MCVLNWLKILVFVGLGVFLLSLPALGAEAPTVPNPPAQEEGLPKAKTSTVEQLPEIEVTAVAEPAPTGSVIKREEMSIGPSQNLPGFFDETSGVSLTRSSLLGQRNSMVKIRAFDESRYQVYMNGRSLKGSGVYGGYYVDWSLLNQANIERVEIIRGAQSAEYGNSLGGIVDITTLKGSKEPKLCLDARYGSWDTQNYRLSHTYSYGPLLWSLAANYGKSSGYLRNNFTDGGQVSGDLTYNFPWDLAVTLGASYVALHNGMIVPNREYLPFFRPNEPRSDGDPLFGPYVPFKGGALNYGDNSYVYTQRSAFDLAATQKWWQGESVFHLFYFQTSRQDKFYALNDRNRLIVQRGSLDEDTWGWNFKTHQTLGRCRIGFGVEGNYYGYGGMNYEYLDPFYLMFIPSPSFPKKNAQKIHGGFVDLKLPLTSYLEFYTGLRYDNYVAAANVDPTNNIFNFGLRKDFVTPKGTLTIRPTATTEVYLSTNLATRFPTTPEYYWFGAGYQPPQRVGNLAPEFGMQYEAGVVQYLPRNSLVRVRGYYYDINQYIRTVYGFRPNRVVYNIDLVEIRGVEVEGEMGLPYNLKAFANYTWQQNSTSPDPLGGNIRELTEIPEHMFNIGLKYKSAAGAEAKAYVRMVSKRSYPEVQVNGFNQLTGVTLRPMKGFFTVNFEGRYPVANWQGFTGYLYGGVNNLFGEYYEEVAGYPMPTQTFYGGVQLRY
jgi:iron complex outermembrane receptor protein